MDVYPYDIETMFRLIGILNRTNNMELMKKAAEALKREFRPLRGLKDNVGSDVRFPFFAKQAGYDLYLNPDVQPGHTIQYYVSGDDYKKALEANLQNDYESFINGVITDARMQNQEWVKYLNGLTNGELNRVKKMKLGELHPERKEEWETS